MYLHIILFLYIYYTAIRYSGLPYANKVYFPRPSGYNAGWGKSEIF